MSAMQHGRELAQADLANCTTHDDIAWYIGVARGNLTGNVLDGYLLTMNTPSALTKGTQK